MTCFVFCHQISFTRKNERKVRIKTKKWEKEKMNFQPWTLWFWRTSEAKKSEKNNWKRTKGVKGRHWKKKDERWREEKKRKEMGWCTECPGAEINDKWVHTDLTRSPTSRHAAMVKRAFNRARDPQRVRILKWVFFLFFFFDGFYFVEGNSNYLKTNLCCM